MAAFASFLMNFFYDSRNFVSIHSPKADPLQMKMCATAAPFLALGYAQTLAALGGAVLILRHRHRTRYNCNLCALISDCKGTKKLRSINHLTAVFKFV